MTVIAAEDLVERLAVGQRPYLLDIRRRSDYNAGHIPGSVNIDVYDALRTHKFSAIRAVENLPIDRPIIVVCYRGRTATIATRFLESVGYNAVTLAGGWTEWRRRIDHEV